MKHGNEDKSISATKGLKKLTAHETRKRGGAGCILSEGKFALVERDTDFRPENLAGAWLTFPNQIQENLLNIKRWKQ